jgi:hypothetical protein
MREVMPAVAWWVDDLRQAFGAPMIDGAIRSGLRGHPHFWAREGGHEIGTRPSTVEDNDEARDLRP